MQSFCLQHKVSAIRSVFCLYYNIGAAMQYRAFGCRDFSVLEKRQHAVGTALLNHLLYHILRQL